MGLPESRLIALGALFDAFGQQWKASFDESWFSSAATSVWVSGVPGAVAQALEADTKEFGQPWPPTSDEIQTFERLLAGVRMPGDVEIIRPRSREAPSTDAHELPPTEKGNVESGEKPEPEADEESKPETSGAARTLNTEGIRSTHRTGPAKKKAAHKK
jgi:hypothetical protein